MEVMANVQQWLGDKIIEMGNWIKKNVGLFGVGDDIGDFFIKTGSNMIAGSNATIANIAADRKEKAEIAAGQERARMAAAVESANAEAAAQQNSQNNIDASNTTNNIQQGYGGDGAQREVIGQSTVPSKTSADAAYGNYFARG